MQHIHVKPNDFILFFIFLFSQILNQEQNCPICHPVHKLLLDYASFIVYTIDLFNPEISGLHHKTIDFISALTRDLFAARKASSN